MSKETINQTLNGGVTRYTMQENEEDRLEQIIQEKLGRRRHARRKEKPQNIKHHGTD